MLVSVPSILPIKSQLQIDSIEINHGYRCNGKRLSYYELLKKTETFSAAHKEMKISNKRNTVSMFFLFIGGAGMAWHSGAVLVGGSMNWTLFGIATGLTAVSIPIHFNAIKHKKNAVAIYNNELNQVKKSSTSFSVGSSNEGIAIAFNF